MPIDIDEFESGAVSGPSVPERIVSFLARNDDQAYTRAEIADAIGAEEDTVSVALSRLASRDLVRHRGHYWAITDERERVREAYDVSVDG